jgi:hypothetical protein
MGTHSRDGRPMQSWLLDQYATGWLGPWLDPLYLLVCCTFSTVVLCAGLQACISCSRCCALGFVGTPPCVAALFHTGLPFSQECPRVRLLQSQQSQEAGIAGCGRARQLGQLLAVYTQVEGRCCRPLFPAWGVEVPLCGSC